MQIQALLRDTGISYPAEAAEWEISSIVTDSRRAISGCLFVCIKGLHRDSHAFIAEAVRNGARAVLTENEEGTCVPSDVLVLTSEDTRSALATLCNAFWGDPVSKLRIIGVTGTNGKTSVTHLLRAIFEGAFHSCGLVGTLGCYSGVRRLDGDASDSLANMTTPDPEGLYRYLAQMVADGIEYVFMEVSSHALALRKLVPINFSAMLFTNLTPDHLDFHGCMEDYARAKAQAFAQSELAILNADDPYASYMRGHARARVVNCSAKGSAAEYRAEEIESLGEKGVRYRLRSKKNYMTVLCPVPGNFTVANSMQAAACALECGISPSVITDALRSVSGIKGRMERVRLPWNADLSVYIDYAHTPDALENLMRTVLGFRAPNQRVTLLFGCGGDRDTGKRAVMGRIAETYADRVIVTSDNSRSESPESIIEEILSGMEGTKPCTAIPDRKDAIRYAVLSAEREEIVLLSGKGHEEYEIVGGERRPFFERAIVTDSYRERRERNKRG